MMKKHVLLAFLAAMAVAGPALADEEPEFTWSTPDNGTMSAMMMKDGDVMMKIQVPHDEFMAMTAGGSGQHGTCTVKEIYPGATDTMILVCKPGRAGGG